MSKSGKKCCPIYSKIIFSNIENPKSKHIPSYMMYIYIIHIIYTFLVASPALKSKNTPFNPYPSLSNVGQSSLYARDTIIFVGKFQILTCTIILLVGKSTILLVKSKILSVQSTSVVTSTFLLLNSLIFPTKTPIIIGTIYIFTWQSPHLLVKHPRASQIFGG